MNIDFGSKGPKYTANFAYVRLINKPYENEVTLTGQKPPLKYRQTLEILTHFITGLDLFFILEKLGSVGQGATKLLDIKL